MKTILNLSLILLTLNFSLMAQNGFEVQKEIIINATTEETWDLVGPGFVDVYKWASNVDHATGKGAAEFEGASCSERSCNVNVSGFSKINEKLTNYNQNKMTLTYEVNEGMPGFVTKAANTWTVVPINQNQSKLVMNADFEVKGFMGFLMKGMMKRKMNKALEMVLNDAKVYIETGKVSEAKAKRIRELERKSKSV